MPQLRRESFSNQWTIMAPERTPWETEVDASIWSSAPCPLCPGCESETPQSLLVRSTSQSTGKQDKWSVRVFPSRVPMFRVEEHMDLYQEGVKEWMGGVGAHEIIVETPDHHADWDEMPIGQITRVFDAYRARIIDLHGDGRLKYMVVFRNRDPEGKLAPAHPHSHLTALAVPTVVQQRDLDRGRRHHDQHGSCLWCDMINQELREECRLVYDSDEFIGFAPYASCFPFEVWLLPKRHVTHFERSGDHLLEAAARGLNDVVGRLNVELEKRPYTMILHTAPRGDEAQWSYHWRIQIVPRLGQGTWGFEMATGFHINSTPPEEAARHLRRVNL